MRLTPLYRQRSAFSLRFLVLRASFARAIQTFRRYTVPWLLPLLTRIFLLPLLVLLLLSRDLLLLKVLHESRLVLAPTNGSTRSLFEGATCAYRLDRQGRLPRRTRTVVTMRVPQAGVFNKPRIYGSHLEGAVEVGNLYAGGQ